MTKPKPATPGDAPRSSPRRKAAQSLFVISIAIGVVPSVTRIVRSLVMDERTREYVSAARLRGLNKGNIEVRIYEGSGHALEDPLGRGNDLIRAEVLAAVREFIFAVE